jgi:lysophospholipase L1-like esterase
MPRGLIPLVALAALLLTVHLVAPPATGAAGEVAYLALGDSVASGADLGEAVSYPRRLGERLANETGRSVRFWNRARAGEQSGGVVAAQLDGMDELDPRVVTLTVGANDFLVPTFECIASMVDDAPGMPCRLPDPRTTLPALEANLHLILTRVTSETEATVAVTNYYNPFPNPSRCGPALAEAALRPVNATIAAVVADYRDRAALVDLTAVFRGHEGREPAGWFAPNPLRLACTDIHPNREGHQAIADAVWAAIAPRIR